MATTVTNQTDVGDEPCTPVTDKQIAADDPCTPNIPEVPPDIPVVPPHMPVVPPDIPLVPPDIPVVPPDIPLDKSWSLKCENQDKKSSLDGMMTKCSGFESTRSLFESIGFPLDINFDSVSLFLAWTNEPSFEDFEMKAKTKNADLNITYKENTTTFVMELKVWRLEFSNSVALNFAPVSVTISWKHEEEAKIEMEGQLRLGDSLTLDLSSEIKKTKEDAEQPNAIENGDDIETLNAKDVWYIAAEAKLIDRDAGEILTCLTSFIGSENGLTNSPIPVSNKVMRINFQSEISSDVKKFSFDMEIGDVTLPFTKMFSLKDVQFRCGFVADADKSVWDLSIAGKLSIGEHVLPSVRIAYEKGSNKWILSSPDSINQENYTEQSPDLEFPMNASEILATMFASPIPETFLRVTQFKALAIWETLSSPEEVRLQLGMNELKLEHSPIKIILRDIELDLNYRKNCGENPPEDVLASDEQNQTCRLQASVIFFSDSGNDLVLGNCILTIPLDNSKIWSLKCQKHAMESSLDGMLTKWSYFASMGSTIKDIGFPQDIVFKTLAVNLAWTTVPCLVHLELQLGTENTDLLISFQEKCAKLKFTIRNWSISLFDVVTFDFPEFEIVCTALLNRDPEQTRIDSVAIEASCQLPTTFPCSLFGLGDKRCTVKVSATELAISVEKPNVGSFELDFAYISLVKESDRKRTLTMKIAVSFNLPMDLKFTKLHRALFSGGLTAHFGDNRELTGEIALTGANGGLAWPTPFGLKQLTITSLMLNVKLSQEGNHFEIGASVLLFGVEITIRVLFSPPPSVAGGYLCLRNCRFDHLFKIIFEFDIPLGLEQLLPKIFELDLLILRPRASMSGIKWPKEFLTSSEDTRVEETISEVGPCMKFFADVEWFSVRGQLMGGYSQVKKRVQLGVKLEKKWEICGGLLVVSDREGQGPPYFYFCFDFEKVGLQCATISASCKVSFFTIVSVGGEIQLRDGTLLIAVDLDLFLIKFNFRFALDSAKLSIKASVDLSNLDVSALFKKLVNWVTDICKNLEKKLDEVQEELAEKKRGGNFLTKLFWGCVSCLVSVAQAVVYCVRKGIDFVKECISALLELSIKLHSFTIEGIADLGDKSLTLNVEYDITLALWRFQNKSSFTLGSKADMESKQESVYETIAQNYTQNKATENGGDIDPGPPRPDDPPFVAGILGSLSIVVQTVGELNIAGLLPDIPVLPPWIPVVPPDIPVVPPDIPEMPPNIPVVPPDIPVVPPDIPVVPPDIPLVPPAVPSNEPPELKVSAITRASLGRMTHMGGLYDVRSESFLLDSVFSSKLTDDDIDRTDLGETEVELVLSDRIEDKFHKLGIEPELQISLLSRLVKLSGSGNYLGEDKKSARAARMSLIYKVRTICEQIHIGQQLAKIDVDILRSIGNSVDATYVVVGIEWGAVCSITCEDENEENEDITKVKGALSSELNRLKDLINFKGSDRADYEATSVIGKRFSFYSNCDVSRTYHNLPVTCEEAIEHVKNLPNLVKKTNQGKGVPLTFVLVPLEKVLKMCNLQVEINIFFQSIPENIVQQYVQAVESLTETRQKLYDLRADLDKGKNYIPDSSLNDINKLVDEFSVAESKFRIDLRDRLKNVRSKREDISSLDALIAESVGEQYSTSSVQEQMRKYQLSLNEVSEIGKMEKLGIVFVGKQDEINIQIEREVYVLYVDKVTSEQQKTMLNKSKSFFLKLHQSHKSDENVKFYVVDSVLRPDLGQSNKFIIAKYINGEIVSSDVLKDEDTEKCLIETGDVHPSKDQPKKQALVQLRCPNAVVANGQCSGDSVKWFCKICKGAIWYCIQTKHFYCKCGFSNPENALFRCNDINHGIDFIQYPKDVLVSELSLLRSAEEINILILGETGVGKSTWINAFANYLHFENLEDAISSEDFITFIPSKFTFTDDEGMNTDIVAGKVCENESFTADQAARQEIAGYRFEVGGNIIYLIDTPGIGDARGIEHDKENFDNILAHLANYEEIHAVLILLNPNNARLTVFFRFCIQQLLTHLHKDALKNICFCFTNTRGTFYRPGDTLPALRGALRDKDVRLEATKDNIFCFDSEAFRFLACIKIGLKQFDSSQREAISQSWDVSMKETKRLLNHIETLLPHKVFDTLLVNYVRKLIVVLNRPIAEISVTIQRNIHNIEAIKEKIDLSDQDVEHFTKDLYFTGVDLVYKQLDYPRTVCTHADCIEYIETGKDNRHHVHYKQHCHPHCNCVNGVPTETVGDSRLQSCSAMTDNMCRQCGHSYNVHMHITYDVEIVKKKFIYDHVQAQIDEMTRRKSKMEEHKAQLDILLDELQSEHADVYKIAAKFGSFLRNQANIPCNDDVGDYLDMIIAQENEKDPDVKDSGLVCRLIDSRKAYEKEKIILENAISENSGEKPSCETEVKNLIQQLFQLKHFGKLFEGIFTSIETYISKISH